MCASKSGEERLECAARLRGSAASRRISAAIAALDEPATPAQGEELRGAIATMFGLITADPDPVLATLAVQRFEELRIAEAPAATVRQVAS
jgi:hypothetical protein